MPEQDRRWKAVLRWFSSKWAPGGSSTHRNPRSPDFDEHFWNKHFPPAPGGPIRSAAGDLGYQIAMGFSWLNVPGTQMFVASGNLLQGSDWFARGIEESGKLDRTTQLGLISTVGVTGLLMAARAAVGSARAVISRVRETSYASGLDAGASGVLAEQFGLVGAPGASASYARYTANAINDPFMQLIAAQRGGPPGQVYNPSLGDPLAMFGLSAFDQGGFPGKPRAQDQVAFEAARDLAMRRRRSASQAAIEQRVVGSILLGSEQALGFLADRFEALAKAGRAPKSFAQLVPPAGLYSVVTPEALDAERRLSEASYAMDAALRTLGAEVGVTLLPIVAAFASGMADSMRSLTEWERTMPVIAGTSAAGPGGTGPGSNPAGSAGGWGAERGPVSSGGLAAVANAGRLVAWGLGAISLGALIALPIGAGAILTHLPFVGGLLAALGAVMRAAWGWLTRLWKRFFDDGGGVPAFNPNTPPFGPECRAATAQWATQFAADSVTFGETVAAYAQKPVDVSAGDAISTTWVWEPATIWFDDLGRLHDVAQAISTAFMPSAVPIPDLALVDSPVVRVGIVTSESVAAGQSAIPTWTAWKATAPAIKATVTASYSGAFAAVHHTLISLPAFDGLVVGVPITISSAIYGKASAYDYVESPTATPAFTLKTTTGFAGAKDESIYRGYRALARDTSQRVGVDIDADWLRHQLPVAIPENVSVPRITANAAQLQWQLDSPWVATQRVYYALPLAGGGTVNWRLIGEWPVADAVAGQWWTIDVSSLQAGLYYVFGVQATFDGRTSPIVASPWVYTSGEVIIGPPGRAPWKRADPDELLRRIEAFRTLEDFVAAQPAIPGAREAPYKPQVLVPVFDASTRQWIVSMQPQFDADVAAVYAWVDDHWLLAAAVTALGIAVTLRFAPEALWGPLENLLWAGRSILVAAWNAEKVASLAGAEELVAHGSPGTMIEVRIAPELTNLRASEVAYGWVVIEWEFGWMDSGSFDGFYLWLNEVFIGRIPPNIRRHQIDGLYQDSSYTIRLAPYKATNIDEGQTISIRTAATSGYYLGVSNLSFTIERKARTARYRWDDPLTSRRDIIGYDVRLWTNGALEDHGGPGRRVDTGTYRVTSWTVAVIKNIVPGDHISFDVRVVYTTAVSPFKRVEFTFPLPKLAPAPPQPLSWHAEYDKENGAYAAVGWTPVREDEDGDPITGLSVWYTFARRGPGDANWISERDGDTGDIYVQHLHFEEQTDFDYVWRHLRPDVWYEFACFAHNVHGTSNAIAISMKTRPAPFVMPGVQLDGVAMADDEHVQVGWEVVPEDLAFAKGAPYWPGFFVYWRPSGVPYLPNNRWAMNADERTAKVPIRNGYLDMQGGVTYFFQVVYAAINPQSGVIQYSRSNEIYLKIPDTTVIAPAPEVHGPEMGAIDVSESGLVTINWEYSTDFTPNPSRFVVMRSEDVSDDWLQRFHYAGASYEQSSVPGTGRSFLDFQALGGFYNAYYVVAQGLDGAGVVQHQAASVIKMVYVPADSGTASPDAAMDGHVNINPALANQPAIREAANAFIADLRARLAEAGIT